MITRYKPWRVSGSKASKKLIYAELNESAAKKRAAALKEEGFKDIIILSGKESEESAAA